MKRKSEQLFCIRCGQSLEVPTVISRWIPDHFLDGKPLNIKGIPDPMECPSCHLISYFPWRSQEDLSVRLMSARLDGWRAEFEGRREETLEKRRLAAELFAELADQGISLDEMGCYIDTLRQLGDFDKAQALISEIRELPGEEASFYEKLLAAEMRWMEAGDTKPHRISEAEAAL